MNIFEYLYVHKEDIKGFFIEMERNELELYSSGAFYNGFTILMQIRENDTNIDVFIFSTNHLNNIKKLTIERNPTKWEKFIPWVNDAYNSVKNIIDTI